MKISNTNPNAVASTKLGTPSALDNQKTEGTKAQSSASSPSSAQVELSQEARDIQKAMDLAKVDSSVDMEKVNRLQKLIDSGGYSVDAQSIADRLVDEHFKMPT